MLGDDLSATDRLSELSQSSVYVLSIASNVLQPSDAVSQYGEYLVSKGRTAIVRQNLVPIIQPDLDYVVSLLLFSL